MNVHNHGLKKRDNNKSMIQEETVNAGFFEKIRQPLICAAKVFVFFLISQPLIYLFQVPFSQDGWGLFRYYPFWFKWTIATIPMAFIGWYINKKNWLSLVILFPVLSLLTVQYVDAFVFTFKHFPLRLVTAVFCLAQVLVYVYVFTPKLVQKLIGILIPLAVVVVIKIVTPFEMFSDAVLPDRITVTRNAIIEVADPEGITVLFSDMEDEDFGYDPILAVHVTKYLTTDMTITDGGNVYRYTLEVYEDEGGHSRIRITAKEHTIVYAGNAGDDVSDDGSSEE